MSDRKLKPWLRFLLKVLAGKYPAVKAAMTAKRLFRFMRRNRPIKRLRIANQIRRLVKAIRNGDEAMYLELFLSLLRHLVPWATALLAGMNIEVGEGTSPVLVVGGAVLVYLAMQAWSFIRKIRNKPRGE